MKRTRGQGLLEFALVMPILLLLLMGIFDFSRVLITYAVATNSLRTGLRLAEVLGYQENEATVPQFANCAAMRDAINETFFAGVPTIHIQYQKAADGSTITCTGPSVSANQLVNGDMLQIRVGTSVNLITPFISNIVPNLPINLRGQRTIVNYLTLTNQYETDKDFDGLADQWEKDNFGGSTALTGTDDPDGDRCNNGCEETRGTNPNLADTDGDCLDDGAEAYSWLTNPLNRDSDGDGLWDGREANPDKSPSACGGSYTGTDPLSIDTDGDTLSDYDEIYGIISPVNGVRYVSNPLLVDSDFDLMTDRDEIFVYGSDPTSPDPCSISLTRPDCDQDRDGLTRQQENQLGTDETNPDTDGDGVRDGLEPSAAALNACDPNPDHNLCDADGDGWTKVQETAAGTNPNLADSDGDGLEDPVDTSPMDPCSPNACAAGQDFDGDGTPDDADPVFWDPCIPNMDAGPCDRDADGMPNSTDPAPTDACIPDMNAGPCDRDGDGLTYSQELAAYTDPTKPDTDDDGINDFNELDLSKTTCLNPRDPDSDDDGWLDGEEPANGTNYCVFDSPATISIADASIAEGDTGTSDMVFTVSLSRANPIAITVNYTTTGVTASPALDFNDTAGMLTIPANQLTATIAVPIIGDILDENQETFTVTLSNPNVGTIVDGSATGTIDDNDPPPIVSVTNVTVVENVAGGAANLVIALNTRSGLPVSVNYGTANGTATAGTDYTATSGTATINPGQLNVTIPVPILNNPPQRYEGNERFTFGLSAPVNGTLGATPATVTITEDDPMPVLTLSATPNPVAESAASVTVTLTLNSASDLVTSVNYATADDTATAGADYVTTSGTASIAAGQTSTNFTVQLTDDTLVELTERFNVNLTAPVNATIGNSPLAVSITDVEDTDGDGVLNSSDPWPNNAPRLSLNTPTAANQHQTQTQTINFVVNLTFPNPGQAYSFSWLASGGTAVGGSDCAAGVDYHPTSGTGTFAAGSPNNSTATIPIIVCAGTETVTETFNVNLTNTSGVLVQVNPGTSTGTIDP